MNNNNKIEIHYTLMNEHSIYFLKDVDAGIRRLFATFNPSSSVFISGIAAIDSHNTILNKSYPHVLQYSDYGYLNGMEIPVDAFFPEHNTESHVEPTEVSKLFGQTYRIATFMENLNNTSLKAIVSISAIVDGQIVYKTNLTGIELWIPKKNLDNFKVNLFEKFPKYRPAFEAAERNPESYIILENGIPKVTIHNVEGVDKRILKNNGELRLDELLYDDAPPF